MSHTTRMAQSRPVGNSRACVCHCGRGPVANSGGRVCRDSSSPANVGRSALAVAYYGDTTMATADHTTSEKQMSKTVNIVAYLDADSEEESRDMMDRLHGGRDYYEESVRERDHYYVVTRNGVMEVNEDEAEMLKDAQGEELMVRHRVEEKTSYANGSFEFSGEFKRNVVSDVDLVPPSVDPDFAFSDRVVLDGDNIFKARASGPKRMGLLKHPSEIDDAESDGVWDDKDADLWALTLTLDVKQLPPVLYRFYDNNVIPEIQENVSKHDWVTRSRVMDCSKEIAEEGVCYDVF